MANSICWECIKSLKSGCSWSDGFVPVEGWRAELNKRTGSYNVAYCPEFVRDTCEGLTAKDINDENMFDLVAGLIDNALTDYEIALEYRERHRRRFHEARLQSDWSRARDELIKMRQPDKLSAIEEVPRWLKSEHAQLCGVGGGGTVHLKYAEQRMLMRRAFRDLKEVIKPWSKSTEFYRMIESLDVVDTGRIESAAKSAMETIGGRRGLLFKWAGESLTALKPTYRLDTIRILKKYVPNKKRGATNERETNQPIT